MDWVALAAVIAGPGVAAIAIIASRLDGRDNRSHSLAVVDRQHEQERALRRSDRLFAQRSEVYVELLSATIRTMTSIDRTHPLVGPMPPPPDAPTDQEWIPVEARTAAFGSPEVLAATAQFVGRARAFFAQAGAWEALDRQGAGEQALAAHRSLDEARDQARAQSREVERLVREELAGL